QGLNKYRVNPRENSDYKLHRPDERTWRDVRLILAQQFTWIGAPHIWMGDELGMWGADDPDCRKPLIWPDLEFEDETAHPFGADRPRDEVRADEELLAYYRHLIQLRRDHPVFVRGGLDVLLTDDECNLLAYERSKGHDRAVVAFNNHEQDTASFLIPLPYADGARVPPTIEWKEVLDLQPVSWELSEGGIEVTMPPKSAAIFLRSFRAESLQPVPHRTQPGADNPVSTQPGANIPGWAKNAVWYQIFPERFRNGDPSNDPLPERIRDPHSWELGAPEGWEISPWTGDWYQRADWEQRVGPDFYDFVFTRRYGGDLQGVIDKLGYLDSLGVTAIYLNPVFDAVSLHKYDASHFHHIDRHFGPDPAGDLAIMAQEDPADPATWQWTSADKLFLELVEKAHTRGIRVILDGVWNHVGRDFWAFRDVQEYGASSRYASWFKITEFGDQYPDGFDYQGWWGYKGLPEFAEDEENLHPEVKQHIFDVTQRWMAPDGDHSRGIDGWRLDMATEVGKEFWREWHRLVFQLNPEALTIAEIWGDEARDFIADDLFGVVMNYRWTYATHAFFIQQTTSASQFVNRLAELRDDFPGPVNLAMQNLLDGHDTERLASMIVNSEYAYKGGMDGEEQAKIRDIDNTYDVRAPNEEERELQRLIALFQFTWPGAPMIYYGTEAGMWGADDPDDRKPMVWNDMEFDDEINHPYSRRRPRDPVAFDHGLFNWYAMLARLRGEREALRTGAIRLAAVSDEHELIAFTRYTDNDFAIVIINRGEMPYRFVYDPDGIELPRRVFDHIGRERYRVRRGVLELTVQPRSAMILAP
ncbi:MAG: alpha-amylase family glycosyl hydrolase, partial [Cyclonatronaceae bacterium]